MVYKDPEYQKKYRKKNKEKRKEYLEKNKDKIKEYYQENKEKLLERQKKYGTTPKGIKSVRICRWKFRGVISDDWDMLNQHWELTSHCDECHVFLEGIGTETKCLDHCHTTGEFRNILCCLCNLKRG
tara:strand:- start:137 stop:517 length:381 start_codon:yes stop_codon:yes gene_type:complete